MLTIFGIISASALMNGISPELQGSGRAAGLNKLIRERLSSSTEFQALGWELAANPSQGELVVLTPYVLTSYPPQQYVQSMVTGGWGIWRGLNVKSFETWNSGAYFGDGNKKIWLLANGLDGVLLDDSGTGVEIDYSFMSSYNDLASPANNKQVNQMHPYFLVSQEVAYTLQARYDFDVAELVATGDSGAPTGALWDAAIFDGAVWEGADFVQDTLGGSTGLGRKVAIAMRGSCKKQTTLIGIDVYYTVGGML